MSLVGKRAPWFKEAAVIDGEKIISDFTLEKYVGKYDVVLFFYPMDFTFVCPTEILAFQRRVDEFHERDVRIVAVSTDTEQSHWAWLHTPIEKGGIQGVTYPIVSDKNKTISKNYGVLTGDYYYDEDDMLRADAAAMVAYRGLFFIDRQGIVRHSLINDMPIGRSVDEVLRVIDAWHNYMEYGEVCPADWHKGEESFKPTHEGVLCYLSKINKEK